MSGYASLRRRAEARYPGESPAKISRHVEIDVTYRAAAREMGKQPRGNIRLRDLAIVYGKMFGSGPLPDTPIARALMWQFAVHLSAAKGPGGPSHIRRFIASHAPWCGPDEIVTLIDDVCELSILPSPDQIGRALGISITQRDSWDLRTVGAVGDSPRARKQRHKFRGKARLAKARRDKGARPHSESNERKQPWLLEGLSRRTWYRRQARGTDSSQ
jgi:hypothetical protein